MWGLSKRLLKREDQREHRREHRREDHEEPLKNLTPFKILIPLSQCIITNHRFWVHWLGNCVHWEPLKYLWSVGKQRGIKSGINRIIPEYKVWSIRAKVKWKRNTSWVALESSFSLNNPIVKNRVKNRISIFLFVNLLESKISVSNLT